jgi:hypothetical protein
MSCPDTGDYRVPLLAEARGHAPEILASSLSQSTSCTASCHPPSMTLPKHPLWGPSVLLSALVPQPLHAAPVPEALMHKASQ